MENCYKCGSTKNLTKHHVLPKFKFNGIGEIKILCRKCHDEIEKIYNLKEGNKKNGHRKCLKEEQYIDIFYDWIINV